MNSTLGCRAPVHGLTRRATLVAAGLALGLMTLPALAGDRGTADEAKAMVAKAIAAFDAKGAAALADMTAPSTAFRDRDLYIFVIGPDHKLVAHGADAKRIGLDVTQNKDSDGKEYGKEIITATAEGIWVDYKFKDPVSGNDAPKSSWVVKHGDYLFGCGIYKM